MMHTQSKSFGRLVRELALAALLAVVISGPSVVGLVAQTPQGGFPDLVAALKATPGVLGVEAGQMQGGKRAIFAWFENKQAVLDWFYTDAHQAVMRNFTPGVSSGRKPLADVPDGTGPILVIASLTYSAAPPNAQIKLPVSQIAVELYTPLPGGLAAGGRFAPASVKLPGLLEAPMSGAGAGR